MTTDVEHIYRYGFASEVQRQAADNRSSARVNLATSGGTEEYPYFFQGALRHPRPAAQFLRGLSLVVSARFHLPPALLKKRILERDPVVTCGGGQLRFEGFSGCGSTYARVDFAPDAYTGVVVKPGTTNVDFNPGLRAALAQIRDHEAVSLAVGTEDLTLLRGQEQVIERRVRLPLRWLRGFAEVQAFQARLVPWMELGKVGAVRFLRSLPRSSMAKTAVWMAPHGDSLRLMQQPAAGSVRLAGFERLRALEELAPLADRLRLFVDPAGSATEWQLPCGPMTFCLTLSAEVWRGFSGEGRLLQDLASDGSEQWTVRVRQHLTEQSEIRLNDLATAWNASPEILRQTLATLGSRGLVGYDLSRGIYFQRQLPFDLSLVEEWHPRLRDARRLVTEGGIRWLRRESAPYSHSVGVDSDNALGGTDDGDGGTRPLAGLILEAEVPGTGVVHRVRLAPDGDRCTCLWHARHQGTRGPCKHVLAVQMLAEEMRDA